MALDRLPIAVLDCDPDGRVRAANGLAGDLFATPADALAQRTLHDLFPREAALPERLAAAGAEPLRLHARRGDRVPFTALVRVTTGPEGLLLTLEAVRDFAHAGHDEDPLEAAFEHLPVGQAIYDTAGRVVRANAALCALMDRPPDELIGMMDADLTHPDDRQADVDAAWRVLEGEMDVWHTEKRFVRPDGSIVWALVNLTFLRDEGRRPLCWIGQFQDITARKEAELELRRQADHDFLTGVASRRRLIDVLGAELERVVAEGGRGVVALIDLDGFKAVNDSRGHDAGDRVLQAIAAALQGEVRVTDTVARLGGDEFAVVLPGADAPAAQRVAAALGRAVDDVEPAVSASIGLAEYDSLLAASPEQLIATADAAMYEAKRRRRAPREARAVGG